MVERGKDQLIEVYQAAEANGELFKLPADRSQTSRERRRGLVLTGLQGNQEVALNPRVCEERGVLDTGKEMILMRGWRHTANGAALTHQLNDGVVWLDEGRDLSLQGTLTVG